MRRPTSTPSGVNPDEKGGRTPAKSPTPESVQATVNVTGPDDPSKRDATLADLRRGLAPASAIEPLLKIEDLGRVLACDRRTVERLKSSARLPKPDLLIGSGCRQSPRWKPATIRAWIEQGGSR